MIMIVISHDVEIPPQAFFPDCVSVVTVVIFLMFVIVSYLCFVSVCKCVCCVLDLFVVCDL